MIVYQESKETFMAHVRESKIDYIIHDNFQKQLGRSTGKREVESWKNSMQYMRNVLDDAAIPNDAKISIECQVPNTSKRIDFIITGQNADKRDCAVIVELKQWETASSTSMDGVVSTYVGGGVREVTPVIRHGAMRHCWRGSMKKCTIRIFLFSLVPSYTIAKCPGI